MAETLSFEHTATNNAPFRLTPYSIPYSTCNIHCYTKDAYYGNRTLQAAKILANDVFFFDNGNLEDLFFKNVTAGQNTKIVAVLTRR